MKYKNLKIGLSTFVIISTMLNTNSFVLKTNNVAEAQTFTYTYDEVEETEYCMDTLLDIMTLKEFNSNRPQEYIRSLFTKLDVFFHHWEDKIRNSKDKDIIKFLEIYDNIEYEELLKQDNETIEKYYNDLSIGYNKIYDLVIDEFKILFRRSFNPKDRTEFGERCSISFNEAALVYQIVNYENDYYNVENYKINRLRQVCFGYFELTEDLGTRFKNQFDDKVVHDFEVQYSYGNQYIDDIYNEIQNKRQK